MSPAEVPVNRRMAKTKPTMTVVLLRCPSSVVGAAGAASRFCGRNILVCEEEEGDVSV